MTEPTIRYYTEPVLTHSWMCSHCRVLNTGYETQAAAEKSGTEHLARVHGAAS